MYKRSELLCLFDVDGTLTQARAPIDLEFEKFLLEQIKPKSSIALVGGSDFNKIAEQMGGEDVVLKYDYVFPENGLVAFSNGKEVFRENIQGYFGEEKLQDFINYSLEYLSKIRLPVKRGTFIEFRSGMLNISPIGRSCSREERNAYEVYDKKHLIREQMIEVLKEKFSDFKLKYSIGGQISFDVFPIGWDKTYCLNHVSNHFKEIHFFGDKTDLGGNDYEIFVDSRVIGHKVTSPLDTKNQLQKLFNL